MTLRVDSKTRLRLALLFAIPLAFSLLFFLANERSQSIDIEFFQLHNLVSSVRTLLSIAKDVELGERSFLLTGDERDLASLKQARAWLPGEINRCRAYARDVPASKRKVEQIVALVQKRVTQPDQVLARQSATDSASALELTRSDATHETMDAIRQSVNDLETDLNREQSAYLDRQRALNRSTFILFLVGTLIMIVVMAALYNALLHFLQARDTAQGQLQALHRALEARI